MICFFRRVQVLSSHRAALVGTLLKGLEELTVSDHYMVFGNLFLHVERIPAYNRCTFLQETFFYRCLMPHGCRRMFDGGLEYISESTKRFRDLRGERSAFKP